MIRTKQLLTSALALGLSAGLASGQILPTEDLLAQWTFADDLEPTTVATGASVSAFQNSAELTSGPYSGGAGPNLDGSSYPNNEPWRTADGDLPNSEDGRTFARPFNDLDTTYHHFTITANDQSFTLGSIGFDVGWRDGGGDELRVQYSFSSDFSNPVTVAHMKGHTDAEDVDGLGVGPVDSETGLPTTGTSGNFGGTGEFNWNRYLFDINDTLAQGDTVYFRIQGDGQTRNEGNIHMDNITVAIPEPSTYAALFGLLGLGLVILMRRRKA